MFLLSLRIFVLSILYYYVTIRIVITLLGFCADIGYNVSGRAQYIWNGAGFWIKSRTSNSDLSLSLNRIWGLPWAPGWLLIGPDYT
jgi:hypothetical protein